MQRSFSSSTGFHKVGNQVYIGEAIDSHDNPIQPQRMGLGYASPTDYGAKQMLKRSVEAYKIDGFVRIAVDRHSEMFKDFDFRGGEEQVKYLKARFALMGLRTGEHYKTTLTRYCHEYFLHGNPMMLKMRGNNSEEDRDIIRTLYEEKPYPISGIFIESPQHFDPYVKDGRFYGWAQNNAETNFSSKSKKIETVIGKTKRAGGFLMSKTPSPPSSPTVNLFKVGLDLIHTPYKKLSDSYWGWGLSFGAIDDINLLRNVEQTTAIAIKKNTIPLLWHRVLRPSNPMIDPRVELQDAARMHRTVTQDGVLVTPGTHELKMLGSESQAIRTEGYLKYYAYRAFADLGVSPFLMGFEPGTIGTAEAAIELLMNRIRFCQQELAIGLEMFLINELLWEGGYDPYRNEEDQVKLIFKEMDETRLIKLRSHFVDLYTKNILTFEETRDAIGYEFEADPMGLYLERVAIPLERVKGENKVEVAQIAAAARPTTRKEVAEFFEHYFGKVTADEFIDQFRRDFNVTLSEFEEGCTILRHDPEALLEYLVLVTVGEEEENE
jgi:hypothetical protein